MLRNCLGGLFMALVLAGCAGESVSPDVYTRRDARTVYRVREGNVSLVEEVRIEGDVTSLGTIGGYVVGWSAGRGTGSRTTAAVGGIAGAMAGQVAEKAIGSEDALRITVDLDDGSAVVIVQSDAIRFEPGDRVRVLLQSRNQARVVRKY